MSSNIWLAAGENDLAAVEGYLNSGVPVDAQDEWGYSPLAAAASYSLVDIVRLLLGRGANPNICDNDNDTPLHVCESPECADLLLKAGANLHAVNSQGRNAADSAVENEQPEMVAFFASLGLVPSMAPSEAEPELVLPDDPNYDPAIHGVIRIVGEQDDDEADDTSMDASSSA